MYEYRVVPFTGHAKALDPKEIAAVAAQLADLINQQAAQGWEYLHIAAVQIAVNPGCLGGLAGRKSAFVALDQVVFRRAKQ